MNKQAIYDIIDKLYMEIYSGYFGCGMLTLYGNGEYEFDTLEEEIEAFLYLFKKFVDNGLILVLPPIKGEPTKKVPNDNANDDFWDVSSDKMVEYIRSVMPKNLKFLNGGLDDKDDEWGKFWYGNCPWIRWVDKNDGNKVY